MMLTIITVTYNNSVGLRKTLESVRGQTSENYLHIVMDGDSSDNTIQVASNFASDKLLFISESDDGIYDAMNKSLDVAARYNSDFVCFLNAGDVFSSSNVISRFQQVVESQHERNCVYSGNTNVFYGDIVHSIDSEDRVDLSHQSVFIPLPWHLNHRYQLQYPICADRVLLSKLQEELLTVHLGFCVSNFELGGVSNLSKSLVEALSHAKELNSIYSLNFHKAILNYGKFTIRFLLAKILTKDCYYKIMSSYWFKKKA